MGARASALRSSPRPEAGRSVPGCWVWPGRTRVAILTPPGGGAQHGLIPAPADREELRSSPRPEAGRSLRGAPVQGRHRGVAILPPPGGGAQLVPVDPTLGLVDVAILTPPGGGAQPVQPRRLLHPDEVRVAILTPPGGGAQRRDH